MSNNNLQAAFLTIALLPKEQRDLLGRIARKGVRITSRGCWEYLGGKGHGYGVINSACGGRTGLVHRILYELFEGEIPNGFVGRHTCDNTFCVNPAHILPGTQRQNVADCVERNRRGDLHGANASSAKLTVEQVREIRLRHREGVSAARMGRDYGVSDVAVLAVLTHKTWKRVS